jgi:glycosyltransferase involved in cell wall biosynthesis
MEAETGVAEGPVLSVIVPVRNGAEFLPRSLSALRGSTTGNWAWELIVVDDGSTDSSADIAEPLADRVIRLPAPVRPSAARNAGAAAARGQVLVFVDADVCVHPDALGRIHDCLSAHPQVDAVFGAYDVSPVAPGLVSQYRNLLHHYVHQREAGETVTFWAGLGAVRRGPFEHVGQFDDRQHLVEDIELGYRLSERGYRILLRPEIQGTHLKRWTLDSMVVADVWHRGVPWVRLLLERRHAIRRVTLNIRAGEQALTGLAAAAVLLVVAGVVTGRSSLILLASLAAVLLVACDWRFSWWLARTRGWWFAVRTVPLRLMYYALNVLSVGIGLCQAWAHRRLPAAISAAPAVREVDKSPA